MATVTTHKGWPFYDWYVSVYGYAPPATVDSNATRYLAWQQGLSKTLAELIPYGSMGPPGVALAGGAVVAPVEVTTPSAPAPAPAPLAAVLETGTVVVAPVAPAPSPAPTAAATDVTATAASAGYPTVYGVRYTADNLAIARTLLAEAVKWTKLRIVYDAIIYAATGESNMSAEVDNGGPLQTTCNMSAYDGGRDWAAQADSWLNGGECFARGGISYASEYSQAWQIAGATEENKVWGDSKGDSYARSGYTTAMLTAEAENTVSYILPGLGTSTASQQVSAPSPAVNLNTGSINTGFSGINWAGDFENLWKYVVGGADEAANMADKYKNSRVNLLTVIGWS